MISTPRSYPDHKGKPHKIGRADAEVNEVNWFFQISEGVFEKWTFINVLFAKKSFRFEKNIDFVTQSIMLTFTFFSWFFCYDNFFSKILEYRLGDKGRHFCIQKCPKKMPKNAVFFLREAWDVKWSKYWIIKHVAAHWPQKSLQKFTKVYKKTPKLIMLSYMNVLKIYVT